MGKIANGFKSARTPRDFPTDMKEIRIDPELLSVVSEQFAREHKAVPVYRKNGSIVMAVTESATSEILDYVKFRSGSPVDFVIASP